MAEIGFDEAYLKNLPVFKPSSEHTNLSSRDKPRRLLVLRDSDSRLLGAIDAGWILDDPENNFGLGAVREILNDISDHAMKRGANGFVANDILVAERDVGPIEDRLTNDLKELTGGRGWFEYEYDSDGEDSF